MNRKAQSTDLLDQYIEYFNRRRNAGIERIASTDEGVAIRYRDGRHDVALGDVLKWMDLFNKLNELHPQKPPV